MGRWNIIFTHNNPSSHSFIINKRISMGEYKEPVHTKVTGIIETTILLIIALFLGC